MTGCKITLDNKHTFWYDVIVSERIKMARGKQKKTPWQRIIEASEKGVGIRLSWEEVSMLCMDDAIVTRAMLDDENDKGIGDEDVPRGFE